MITIKNNGKDPNELHQHLINNACKPIALTHNAKYDELLGIKTQEATEIYIVFEPEKEDLLNQLVQQFMSQ